MKQWPSYYMDMSDPAFYLEVELSYLKIKKSDNFIIKVMIIFFKYEKKYNRAKNIFVN